MLGKKVLLTLLFFFPLQLMSVDTVERPQGDAKFVPIAVGGITIIIPVPIELDSPIGQAKRFVSAYLAENEALMQQITSKQMINKLKTVDDEVKDYFGKITSYHEMLYFHDLKALVIAVSQGEEIKFYFSWSGSRWILDRVL
ncbi:hypothetical protein KKC13_09950 [bacterium]|nr:hypothetical protein [bacterium]MBU1956947.1 hypothetical protein [bacterium]